MTNQTRKEIKDLFLSRVSLTVKNTIAKDLDKYDIPEYKKTDIQESISVCVNLVLNIIL